MPTKASHWLGQAQSLFTIFSPHRNALKFAPSLAAGHGQSSSLLDGKVRWGGVPKALNDQGVKTVAAAMPSPYFQKLRITERPLT